MSLLVWRELFLEECDWGGQGFILDVTGPLLWSIGDMVESFNVLN